jgi:signal transduction histidine kinase
MAFDTPAPLNATTIAAAAISMAAASLVWWSRVRRLTRLRQTVALIHALTEEILGAQTAQEILSRIEGSLPPELGLHSTAIFALNEDGSLAVAAGAPASVEAAERCHAERAVEVRETVLSLPMTVRGEARGVLQLSGNANSPQQDEMVALQHLANQVAIGLQLLSQRHMREQLLRSEKLGAVGQLISSIAAELKPPLERIARSGHEEVEPALETLGRLISFGRPDQARVHAVDLNAVLRQLLEFRAQPWRLQLIQAETSIPAEPMMVLASRGPLEQSLLSLLVHAEQSLEAAPSRVLRVSSGERGGRARLVISFTAPPARGGPDTEIGAWGLDVTRGLIESHGGELQVDSNGAETALTVALPLTDMPIPAAKAQAQPEVGAHTLLLVHSDQTALRAAIVSLCGMDQRAIPAVSASEALECASRFHFDAILATRHLPDQSWQQFAERAREYAPVVGLLATGSDPAPIGVPCLRLPADESELLRFLTTLEPGP